MLSHLARRIANAATLARAARAKEKLKNNYASQKAKTTLFSVSHAPAADARYETQNYTNATNVIRHLVDSFMMPHYYEITSCGRQVSGPKLVSAKGRHAPRN